MRKPFPVQIIAYIAATVITALALYGWFYGHWEVGGDIAMRSNIGAFSDWIATPVSEIFRYLGMPWHPRSATTAFTAFTWLFWFGVLRLMIAMIPCSKANTRSR